MRLFVHLINFTEQRKPELKKIKILKDNQIQIHNEVIILHLNIISSTDYLIEHVCNRLLVKQAEVIIKLVVVGNKQEKRIRILRGFDIGSYINIFGEDQGETSIYNFQMELQIELIYEQSNPSQVRLSIQPQIQNSNRYNLMGDLSDSISEIYKCSNQLFEHLHNDNYQSFKCHLQGLKVSSIKLRNVLNLYNIDNGYTLLLLSIYYNRNQFLQKMLKDYGKFINMNYKSADGWLPFQLALAIGNKIAVKSMIAFRNNGLDLNFSSSKGQILFNLIDTINIDLISNTIKKIPVRFQDIHLGTNMNSYQYVWNHNRFIESEKRQLLQLMHQHHFEMYDFYRYDLILYSNCKKYLPQIPRYYTIKKTGLSDLTLKIIAGEILLIRNPLLPSKFIFLSVNSYIGQLQYYQINAKLTLNTQKQKLQQYHKINGFPMEEIDFVSMLSQQQKAWHMKQKWFCFIVKDKKANKHVFACTHEYTANQWVEQIKQAIQAWNKNEHKNQKYPTNKNYIKISDVEIKMNSIKKKSGAGIIQFYSSKSQLFDHKSIQSNPNLPQNQLALVKSKSEYVLKDKMDLQSQDSSKFITLKYSDFKMLQLLGEGSFGQVFLAQCLRNNQLYALKMFRKKKIILSKQTKFVIEEVDILKQIKHPFIVTLYFTFQTPHCIYLGLEYSQGKDLAKHLHEESVIPEQEVKIYAAEIVLALEYLHSIGIIYRDLKPENIMLGKDGHILLVDFGLSKRTQGNVTKTFCGSPAYLSPQMLGKHEVGPESDFFGLGVVIFELMFGEPPFYSQNIHVLYQNIQRGHLKFPCRANPATQSLLRGLLQKQPKKRLGTASIEQIKNHTYFSGISWQKLMKKQITAPKRALFQQAQESECGQQLMDMLHHDFDYSQQNYRVNRFRNFSFVRQEQFL